MILWPTHKRRATEARKKHHAAKRRRQRERNLLKDGKRVTPEYV